MIEDDQLIWADDSDDRRVLAVVPNGKPGYLGFFTGVPSTRGDTIANGVFLDPDQVNELMNVLIEWFDEVGP